eukprot:SAG31_NODE_307_length_17957_cov_5.236645_3_plen_87_part_00
MNPNNAHWLHPDDAAKVEALGVKDHAVMDIHLGGGGGVEMAENMFNLYPNCAPVELGCLSSSISCPNVLVRIWWQCRHDGRCQRRD